MMIDFVESDLWFLSKTNEFSVTLSYSKAVNKSLTFSCIMLRKGQICFKNLAVETPKDF